MKMKKIIYFLVFILISKFGLSQIIPYTGQPILTLYQGPPVLVNQIGIPNPLITVAAQAPGINALDLAALNRITLGVDIQHKQFYGAAMNVRIRLNVERWDAQQVALPDTVIQLNVSYNPFTDSTYLNRNSARFSGSYMVKAELDSVFVNGVYNDTLPANLYIQNEILVNRRTFFTDWNTPLEFNSIVAVNTNCDENDLPDHIHLDWTNTVPGISEYQLEWLYINNYGDDPNSTQNSAETTLPYNFKLNSTRITTTNEEYDLSLVFDQGWILFRLRGVGINSNGEFIYGDWNVLDTGLVSDVTSNKFEVTSDMRHHKTLNWQYSATYAEEGKKKEIINYFDGSLRNRQSVTQISSDQNTIVGETIYDYQGRPAISILPAPVVDPSCQLEDPSKRSVLQFYPNFNQSSDSQTIGYSANHFDLSDENNNCSIQAAGMGSQSGASQYYSSNNPDQFNEQAYVPDAQLYPFTQIEYTPDNTGRIRRQGGVGPCLLYTSDAGDDVAGV
jgi:hypothetical protein